MAEDVPTSTAPYEKPGLPALAAALAKAQGDFPAITRGKEVTVQMKTGGSYKFSYAALDTILSAVRAPLAANGLSISQLLDGGDLVTLLMHEGGGVLSCRWRLPSTGEIQALGSAITYLRRYSLQAILGIATEEDDDGNAASKGSAKAAPAKAKPTPTPAKDVAVELSDEDLEAVGDHARALSACESIVDLKAYGATIAAETGLNESQRAYLLTSYLARHRELKARAPEAA